MFVLIHHVISQFILKQAHLVDQASTRKKTMFLVFVSLEIIKTKAYPEKF